MAAFFFHKQGAGAERLGGTAARRRGSAWIMPRFTFQERRAAGEQFIQFLKDSGRQAVSDREVLRTIYAEEFKKR